MSKQLCLCILLASLLMSTDAFTQTMIGVSNFNGQIGDVTKHAVCVFWRKILC
jgi:hypothetical protein